MSLTTLITLNATLAAVLVYGILWLLGHGIHTDRLARASHAPRADALQTRDRDQLAA